MTINNKRCIKNRNLNGNDAVVPTVFYYTFPRCSSIEFDRFTTRLMQKNYKDVDLLKVFDLAAECDLHFSKPKVTLTYSQTVLIQTRSDSPRL